MPTEAILTARHRHCKAMCPFYMRRSMMHRGPHDYNRFCACTADGEPVLLTDPAQWREQDQAFLEGESCPTGAWDTLQPVDLEVEDVEGRVRGREVVRGVRKQCLKLLLQHGIEQLDLSRVRQWIEEAVVGGKAPLWIVVEIVHELSEALGAVPTNARLIILKDGAEAILAADGNTPAYEALRDCVEAEACTRGEAEDVALELGITEPVPNDVEEPESV